MNLGEQTNTKFIGRGVFVASNNYYSMPKSTVGLAGKIVGIGARDKYLIKLPGHREHPSANWYVHPKDLRLLGSVLNQ